MVKGLRKEERRSRARIPIVLRRDGRGDAGARRPAGWRGERDPWDWSLGSGTRSGGRRRAAQDRLRGPVASAWGWALAWGWDVGATPMLLVDGPKLIRASAIATTAVAATNALASPLMSIGPRRTRSTCFCGVVLTARVRRRPPRPRVRSDPVCGASCPWCVEGPAAAISCLPAPFIGCSPPRKRTERPRGGVVQSRVVKLSRRGCRASATATAHRGAGPRGGGGLNTARWSAATGGKACSSRRASGKIDR